MVAEQRHAYPRPARDVGAAELFFLGKQFHEPKARRVGKRGKHARSIFYGQLSHLRILPLSNSQTCA